MLEGEPSRAWRRWRDLRQRPRVLLTTLLLSGFAVCIALWIALRTSVAFVSAWVPNIGADFAGVLVVVLVVERLLVEVREREHAPIRRIAAQRIAGAVYPLALEILRGRSRRRIEMGQGLEERLPVDELMAEWRGGVRENVYAVTDGAMPSHYVPGLRRATREWSSILDRFAASFETPDEIHFIGQIDEFVAWMSLNRDLFAYKVSIWLSAERTAQMYGEERRNSNGGLRLEDGDFRFQVTFAKR